MRREGQDENVNTESKRLRDLFPELADANLTEHMTSVSAAGIDAGSWRPISCLAWDIELKARGLAMDPVTCDDTLAGDVVEARHLGGDVTLFDRAINRGELVPVEQVDMLDENANRVGAAFADWEAVYAETTDEEQADLLERFGRVAAITLERYAALRPKITSLPLASAWGLAGLLQDEAFAFLKPVCASAIEVIGDEAGTSHGPVD